VTIVVTLLGAWNTSLSGIQSVTNLRELSILLFTCYSLIAILPLVAGTNYLRSLGASRPSDPADPTDRSRGLSVRSWRRERSTARWWVVAAVGVLVVPLGSGLAVTATEMPSFVHDYIGGQSNGTPEDLLALEWAGAHLPGCSGVLVAPGSAAQFLPEYTSSVRMIYPIYPTPTNLTYYTVVTNLTAGSYGPPTRAGMLDLGVTVVFVTGATTNTYPAFSTADLAGSPDFSLLYSAGDASLWAFHPGISLLDCVPT